MKILAPGFYARQDIRTPVKIAIGVLIVTQLLNLALVPLLAHAGLALAIGLGACLNAGPAHPGCCGAASTAPAPGWTRFALRLLPALAGLAGCWPMPMAASTGSRCRLMPACGRPGWAACWPPAA